MDRQRQLYTANTTNLAYVGDAVYEVYVRDLLFDKYLGKTKLLHKEAIRYVSAKGQAAAMRAMFEELPEAEQALVKRARNHKSATKPKNADPVEYKWATAFEALVGYYHLLGDEARVRAICQRAMDLTDGTDA